MRSIRWSLILFQLLWLNVILPGHTRGSITIPGSKPSCGQVSNSGSGCCSAKAKQKSESPTPEQKSRCAFCYFAMGMSTPPVVEFNHQLFGLLTLLPIPPPEVAESPCIVLPYHGRAPPLV
jgi:hypothetical protein